MTDPPQAPPPGETPNLPSDIYADDPKYLAGQQAGTCLGLVNGFADGQQDGFAGVTRTPQQMETNDQTDASAYQSAKNTGDVYFLGWQSGYGTGYPDAYVLGRQKGVADKEIVDGDANNDQDELGDGVKSRAEALAAIGQREFSSGCTGMAPPASGGSDRAPTPEELDQIVAEVKERYGNQTSLPAGQTPLGTAEAAGATEEGAAAAAFADSMAKAASTGAKQAAATGDTEGEAVTKELADAAAKDSDAAANVADTEARQAPAAADSTASDADAAAKSADDAANGAP